jgi:choline dehydrogenase
LRPIRHRKNLQVWTESHVDKLLYDRQSSGSVRCVGARIQRAREQIAVTARQEVILSAGAVGTPQILQLSGIGEAAILHKYDIDVIKDAPGVGKNLQDHLQIRTVFKLEGARTLNSLANTFRGKLGISYPAAEPGGFWRAPPCLSGYDGKRVQFESDESRLGVHTVSKIWQRA